MNSQFFSSDCSSPWVLSSPQCFQILHKRANQTVARESCKDVGGRLLEVKGDEKQEAIEKSGEGNPEELGGQMVLDRIDKI